jgi:hypothetical protein
VKAGGTANPYNFICGQVPGVGQAVPVTGSKIIDGNTQLPTNLLNLFGFGPLNIQEAYANQDLPSGVPSMGRLGLLRETLRLSAHITYEINDYSISSLAITIKKRTLCEILISAASLMATPQILRAWMTPALSSVSHRHKMAG